MYTLQHHSNSLKKFRQPLNDRNKKILPSTALTHQFSSKTLKSPIFKAKHNFEEFYNSINRKAPKPEQSLEKPADSLQTVFPLERIVKIKEIVGVTDSTALSDG